MKENSETFKFIDLLICPNCLESNLEHKENYIKCQKCNDKFIFNNQTVVFEEAYKIESSRKSNKFAKLPKINIKNRGEI